MSPFTLTFCRLVDLVSVTRHANLYVKMDKVTEEQREDIKKMSTSRLKLKLLNAGYSDEDIESLDRSTCMEMWA